MLTPVFHIDQTPEYVIIQIHAPYANVKDAEAEYCDLQFFFTSKPYFLKLYLPGELAEDDIEGTYDCDKGSFTFKALKRNVGEFFPNLDLVNQLLKPSDIHAKRLVEETDESGDILANFSDEPQNSQISDVDDFMDEECKLYGYGFAYSRRGVIGKFSTEIGNLLDLKDPEGSLIDERFTDCLRHDQLKFDAEHYIADLFEKNSLLEECLQFEYPETTFDLSFKSRDHLKDLPRKLFPKYSSGIEKAVALSLIDIVFAYLYDMRTTGGEHTSESGRVSLLQCLVDVHIILSTSGDYRYLLNDLFTTDYCLWIQCTSDDILSWLQCELNHLALTKSDVQLDLEEVELEAKLLTLQIDARNLDLEDSDDDSA
ncbi:hypothetical protein LOAG_02546 [Loa loa]|uniref:Protein SHQ1 homolog n=1 Tax=Loa loa TaxID=7209 RepID=A0A1S0U691_LOALO|nr:hypothetical protein LOAG_02546 [Loa loa]EFO25937.1 hypothetical protein LOAG_02546 [Loa loa]